VGDPLAAIVQLLSSVPMAGRWCKSAVGVDREQSLPASQAGDQPHVQAGDPEVAGESGESVSPEPMTAWPEAAQMSDSSLSS
jgi:hypothetical protein